jgi:hypothetical protein
MGNAAMATIAAAVAAGGADAMLLATAATTGAAVASHGGLGSFFGASYTWLMGGSDSGANSTGAARQVSWEVLMAGNMSCVAPCDAVEQKCKL